MSLTQQAVSADQTKLLSRKLQQLAVLRDRRDRASADETDASRAYRALEAECIQQMVEEDTLSLRVAEVGLFSLSTRHYPSVKDMTAFIEWAVEQGRFPNGVIVDPEAHQVTVTFDVAPDEDDPTKMVLVNGALKCAHHAKAVNEEVRIAIDSDSPVPPGVEPNTRFVLAIRRA